MVLLMRRLNLSSLKNLDVIMGNWQGPTLVGGDFILVRNQKEKKQMESLTLTMLVPSMIGSINGA
jgi:hypothetical protein